jgi:hypothetical protein
MIALDYVAVAVAAAAAFVLSSFYYIALSRQWRELSPAATDRSRPPAWKVVGELARNAILAAVVAGLVVTAGITDAPRALTLGVALWIGFPVVLLSGSAIWENVPWRLAAIHSGDWLIKLLVISVIVGVWR